MPRGSLPPSGRTGIADGLMFTIKLLLSLLLVLVALLVLFGGDWDWYRLLSALFFVALSLLTWTMHSQARPSCSARNDASTCGVAGQQVEGIPSYRPGSPGEYL
jgi:4-amino-4-deoxy-L-arabinose transferase-like glycosyltransferase